MTLAVDRAVKPQHKQNCKCDRKIGAEGSVLQEKIGAEGSVLQEKIGAEGSVL